MQAEFFNKYLPIVYSTILSSLQSKFSFDSYIHKILDYNLLGGKLFRGLLASQYFLELTEVAADSERAKIGYTIGWACEILQTAYLIADDLMDQSSQRRSKPCWYLQENVGDMAVNDGLLIQNTVFVLLESLKEKIGDNYYDLIFLFRKVSLETSMGQTLDFLCSNPTFENYEKIVLNKTTKYTFLLPLHAALICSGQKVENPFLFEIIKSVGYFFQVQDDFLDVFGDTAKTGKEGTDLIEQKVTWIVCKFYKVASPPQADEFTQLFQRKDKNDVPRMKSLMIDAGVVDEYYKFVQIETNRIDTLLQDPQINFPLETIKTLWKIVSKREN